jgi:hypothetical protein
MRKIAIGVAALIALGAAGVAQAGPGRCFDAYGRPIGPVYDTDNPNYGWINSVLAQGGSCTGVASDYRPGGNYYYKPEPKYYAPRHEWKSDGGRKGGYDWQSDHGRKGQSHRDAERDRKTHEEMMKNNPSPRS